MRYDAFYKKDFYLCQPELNVAVLFLHPGASSPEGQGFCQAGFSADFLKVRHQG